MAVFFATYFLAQLFVSHKIINNLLFLSLFSQIVAFFIKTFYSLWLLYFLFPLFHCRTYLYSLFWCMLGVLERIWKKSLNWEKFIMVSMASFWHICNNIGFDRGGGGYDHLQCVCVCVEMFAFAILNNIERRDARKGDWNVFKMLKIPFASIRYIIEHAYWEQRLFCA